MREKHNVNEAHEKHEKSVHLAEVQKGINQRMENFSPKTASRLAFHVLCNKIDREQHFVISTTDTEGWKTQEEQGEMAQRREEEQSADLFALLALESVDAGSVFEDGAELIEHHDDGEQSEYKRLDEVEDAHYDLHRLRTTLSRRKSIQEAAHVNRGGGNREQGAGVR